MRSLTRLILALLLISALVLSITTNCKKQLEKTIKLKINGKIIDKYRQRYNKDLRTLTIKVDNQSIKYTYFDHQDFYDLVNIGDSVAKQSQSDLAIIYKTSGDTLRYVFSCD